LRGYTASEDHPHREPLRKVLLSKEHETLGPKLASAGGQPSITGSLWYRELMSQMSSSTNVSVNDATIAARYVMEDAGRKTPRRLDVGRNPFYLYGNEADEHSVPGIQATPPPFNGKRFL
jgi:hypothetical protein